MMEYIFCGIPGFGFHTIRRLGAKGSYLTLVRVADRIPWLRGDEFMTVIKFMIYVYNIFVSNPSLR